MFQVITKNTEIINKSQISCISDISLTFVDAFNKSNVLTFCVTQRNCKPRTKSIYFSAGKVLALNCPEFKTF